MDIQSFELTASMLVGLDQARAGLIKASNAADRLTPELGEQIEALLADVDERIQRLDLSGILANKAEPASTGS